MKISVLLLVTFLVGCAFAAYQDPSTFIDKEDGVLVLNADNFEHAITSNEFLVVDFYAPWCGHCKKLAPEYAAAAEVLATNDPPYTLAKLDTTEAKDVGAKYGIKGYPTLKIFRGETDPTTVTDYSGPREKQGIIEYVIKIAGPPSVALTTADEVTAWTAKSPALVAVIADGADSEAFKAFTLIANTLRDDFEIAHIFDASLTECKNVCLYKNYDTPISIYDGEYSGIAAWANKVSTPSVAIMDRNPQNRKWLSKVFESDTPKLMVIAAYESGDYDALKAELKTVAETNTLDLAFVQADSGVNAGMLTYFGLTEADVPALVIHAPKDAAGDSKYLKFNPQAGDIATFISEWSTGKVERHVKSEEAPAENDGPVKVVVATTFEEIVMTKGKDVLVEFYAPWCGHCKKLAPIFDEVGTHFAKDENIVIAKMDSTANDIPVSGFDVKGFPTLYFVQANGNIKAYSGVRDKDSLIEFVDAKRRSEAPEAATEASAPASDDKEEL